MPISVVINTYNAQAHLSEVLDSVKDFDEVLICDMESTDSTLEIAKKYGCRTISFPKGDISIVEPARQFAIDNATNEWVLVVDSDEIVPSALREFLYSVVLRVDAPAGVVIPRKNYFMGRFMHGAYPDYILRFFRKSVTTWPPIIHSSPNVNGVIERIPLKRKELAFEHLANDSVSAILNKTNNYSEYEVPRRRSKKYGIPALLFRPCFRFVRSYLFKGGFLDGKPGLIHAFTDSIYQFVIVAKHIEDKTDNK